MDGQHDGEYHGEEEQDMDCQVGGLQRHEEAHVALDKKDLDHPWNRQAHEDVEDVRAYGGADRHVTLALPRDCHGGGHVGDGRACGEDGEALDNGIDPESPTDNLHQPHQERREQGDPDKGDGEHPEKVGRAGLREAVVQHVVDGGADEPDVAPLTLRGDFHHLLHRVLVVVVVVILLLLASLLVTVWGLLVRLRWLSERRDVVARTVGRGFSWLGQLIFVD
mmetsp:Transcript_46540/g.120441  ORF Transcript_46540/g.120441 Transcript_46540/m.120441 type:complete len:222 (-) Transcript_46540:1105-1770(-)